MNKFNFFTTHVAFANPGSGTQRIRFIQYWMLLSITILLAATAIGQSAAEKPFVNINSQGIILDGYDAVAFFTDNKPIKGDPQFQFNYEGANYLFASREHLDLFKAGPDKYKPQFGAYCAYAVSLGRIAPIDVNTFSIVNGRLVLQHNERAVNGWNKDVQGNLVLADKYWPLVVNSGGKQIKTDAENAFYSNTNDDGIIMDGYDPVSYFTDKQAQKGDKQYSARYNGATYLFVSQQHADMFKERPAMYAPLYGSFCGYAMAFGRRRPVNPEYWNIVDGYLILQHSKGAWELFNKDIPGFKMKADEQWPPIMKENAGKKVKYDRPV